MKLDDLFRGQPPDELGDKLHALKQEGCAILTTGKVPTQMRAEATRKQLGFPDEDRIRILALTEVTDQDVSIRLPDGCAPDDPRVHIFESQSSRDTATVSTGTMGVDAFSIDHDDALSDLQNQIAETVRQYESASLEGGELRLVVDSLKWLLDEFGIERVEEFIFETAMLVRSVSGMAHYHLPVPTGHEMICRLMESGYFDGRVELLHIEGWNLQRWHFTEFEELPWLKL